MIRLSGWLQDRTTGWFALVALLLFLGFTALVLPRQTAQAEAYSGAAGSPDTSLFYTADELYGWVEAYGEAGRQVYVRARLTFDVVWPLVMARYPATTPVVDALAGPFTLLKWLFVGGSFVLLLVALVAAGWRWMQQRLAS